MSEKIYPSCFVSTPRRFRQQYGAEALQLFQDRMRDERRLAAKAAPLDRPAR